MTRKFMGMSPTFVTEKEALQAIAEQEAKVKQERDLQVKIYNLWNETEEEITVFRVDTFTIAQRRLLEKLLFKLLK